MTPFPTTAPFRVDQVTAAPFAMTGLFLVITLTAASISWSSRQGARRLWWAGAGLLVALVAVFFTLANWGNSDPTKLSHYLAFDLSRVRGEPFWMAMAPLVVRLPYRMAFVHGLVVAGYAGAAILLARRLGAAPWAGWWALLVCCSPLLRSFLQNGVTRQALAALLLLPVLLATTGIAPQGRWRTGAAALWAGTVHTTSLGILALGLVPCLAGDRRSLRIQRLFPPTVDGGRGRRPPSPRRFLRSWIRWIGPLLLALALTVLVGLVVPFVIEKLRAYTFEDSYSSSYAIAASVGRVQLAMVLGVVLTCWHRRLGVGSLMACGLTRQLLLFAFLFLLLQASVSHGWLPQITSRLSDVVGLFLLVSWLGWLARHRSLWAVLPALVVTLETWSVERLLASLGLDCGRNDDFLCLPDRWPWQVVY